MSIHRRINAISAPVGTLIALLLAPAMAQANPAKVVVIPYAPLYDSIPRATGERISGMLEEALKPNAGVGLVSLPAGSKAEAVSMMATPAQKQAVVDALKELEEGKKLLDRRRVKPAFDAFERAIKKMEANATALEEVDPLVEAYLKLAVAHFLMGAEDKAATGPLPKAIILNPSLRLEAGKEYAPVFVQLMEKVRGELAPIGTGSLRVDTTPPGAGIWVDGRDALTSPVMVTGLLPGTHFVKIKLPSTDPYVQKVEIEKDETFHISPDSGAKKEDGVVAGLVSKLSANQLDAEGQAQVKAIAKQTGADWVVIGGAFAKGAAMGIVSYAYDVKNDGFLPLQTITLDRDMLGATIEINKVASEIGATLSGGGQAASLPMPLAADARPGAEKIHEVDFTVSLVPAKVGEEKKGPATPVDGSRRPVGGKRAPIGAPVGGGGTAPEASIETPALEEAVAVAPAPAPVEPEPALDFNFNPPAREEEDFGTPAPTQQPAASYSYAGGVSISDEAAFGEEPTKKKGGLLTKWWFWTAAGVVAGGAVGIAALSSGGGGSAAGHASW